MRKQARNEVKGGVVWKIKSSLVIGVKRNISIFPLFQSFENTFPFFLSLENTFPLFQSLENTGGFLPDLSIAAAAAFNTSSD